MQLASVLLTPRGPGGIAVVQVVGRGAARVVAAKFSRPLPRPGALAVGRLVDEVVVRVVPASESIVREPSVEVSCHGGSAPAEAVMAAIGAERIDFATLLDRAVAARRIDRLCAEAHAALPNALTRLAARVLLAQAEGALSRAVKAGLEGLLETAPAGRAFVEPPRVALVGRANAGKSTLFNALVERERALVSPVAGTTRDPVEEVVAVREVPLRLVDTAGLLPEGIGHGLLEQLSLARTREEIERADLIVLVRDATATDSIEEKAFARWAGSRKAIEVCNKTDLTQGFPPRRPGVSAKTGEGLDRLRGAMVRALGIRRPSPGAAVVFTKRQQTLLEAFAAGARQAEVRRRLMWG
jgi:tRNA modification GTPase